MAPSRFVARVPPRLCTAPDAAQCVVAALLSAQVASADLRGAPPSREMTPFHALEAPAIGVADYVARIATYSFASTATLLAAVHYLKRAALADPRLAPSSLSVHRLLIAATVLAAKFFDDVTYSMGYYAKVGGLPVKELAYLELQLLSVLRFRLHITPAAFHTLENELIASLHFLPRSLAADAILRVAAARIPPPSAAYCEAQHADDAFGLWLPHPDPRAHMAQVELLSSPCSTPPRATSPHKDHLDARNLMRFSESSRRCEETSLDVGSGPLARYGSNASTVTSDGSGCTEGSVFSDGSAADSVGNTPNWAYERQLMQSDVRALDRRFPRIPLRKSTPASAVAAREHWKRETRMDSSYRQ